MRRALGLVAVTALAVGGLAAVPSFGTAKTPVRFSKVYVDKSLAGGEPIVFYDARHQTYIYSSHEGTTHTLRDGLGQAPGETVNWTTTYRNQVNIWTSRDAVHWNRTNLSGTGFFTDPSKNSGFSDPDLTQDDGGRVYNTGINLANDALFSSNDGGRTWDRGTLQCHNGDRPWLAGAHKNEVFLATDPLDTNGHTIYRSTDGGASCSSFGIGDYGPGYGGFGKLYYNRANGSLVEPIIYGSGSSVSRLGVGILPHASQAFAKQHGAFHAVPVAATQGLLTHFPGLSVDSRGNLYLTWADKPADGKNSIWFAMLDKFGKVLVKPHVIAHPGTTVLWPWLVAGAPGNAAVVWYQYDRVVTNPDNADPAAKVYVYSAELLGQGTRHARQITVNASGSPVHLGGICQGGTGCVASGQDRRLGDYLTDNLDGAGCLLIATGDTTQKDPVTGKPTAWSLPLLLHQTSGPSLTHGTCH